MTIAEVRAQLSLVRGWKLLGLPGDPHVGQDIKSPFREDNRASVSIYERAGVQYFFDHAKGTGGDVVDLWAQAKGISAKEALHQIAEFLCSGARSAPPPPPARRPKTAPPPEDSPPLKTVTRWPARLWLPSQDECRALGKLRGLHPGTFELGVRLGVLKAGILWDQKVWILTDPSFHLAEARRFDGKFLEPPGRQPCKSFAFSGSDKHWPVGLITDLAAFDALNNLVLVEGMPDYFAALELALVHSLISLRPIAMLGGARIHPATRPYFRGAHVLILPHNDRPGRNFVVNWKSHVLALGAASVTVQPLPFIAEDLNDFLVLAANPENQMFEPKLLLQAWIDQEQTPEPKDQNMNEPKQTPTKPTDKTKNHSSRL